MNESLNAVIPGQNRLIDEILWITQGEKKLDLTSGSIARSIWLIALPQILTGVTQSLFNLVDMFWVGKLGAAALASVAIAGILMMFLFMVVMGVGTGAAALVARAYGRRDFKQADRLTGNAILLGFLLAVPVTILGVRYTGDLFALMGADTAVTQSGAGYLRLMFGFSVVIFLTFIITAVLRGAGDAVTPMKIMMGALVLNALLDPFLIFGWGPFPRLEIDGAAWATIISRAVAILYLIHKLFEGKLRLSLSAKSFRPAWALIGRILKLGGPNSIQLSIRSMMMIVITKLVASFGTAAVAAYGVGNRLFMLALLPGFGFGIAAAGLVGQNLGAGKMERSWKSAYRSVYYYAVFLGLIMILFLVFPEQLIALFNNDPNVKAIGSVMLRITALGLPFLSLSIVLNRSLGGAGDTVSPMIITLISLWGLQVPLAIWLSGVDALGVSGIFWAGVLANAAAGLMAYFRFRHGSWTRIKL